MHGIYAAGIRIKMFRYIQSLSEEVRQMADEYRFPIFLFSIQRCWGQKPVCPRYQLN